MSEYSSTTFCTPLRRPISIAKRLHTHALLSSPTFIPPWWSLPNMFVVPGTSCQNPADPSIGLPLYHLLVTFHSCLPPPMLRIYHSAPCLLSTLPRRLDRRLNLTSTFSRLLTPAWLIQGVGEELPPPKLSLISPLSRSFIPPSLCQVISPKSEVTPVYPSRAQRRFKLSTSATTLH